MSALVRQVAGTKAQDKWAFVRRVRHADGLLRWNQVPDRLGEGGRNCQRGATGGARRQPLVKRGLFRWLQEVQRCRLDQVVVVAAEWGGPIWPAARAQPTLQPRSSQYDPRSNAS